MVLNQTFLHLSPKNFLFLEYLFLPKFQHSRKQNLDILLVFSLLVSVSTLSQANPGGVGDGVFDMQCGGACHGDSSLNQTSSAIIEFEIQGTPYLEQPISINAIASGSQLGVYDSVGMFLLTDTTGHSDTPRDAGWEILSDSNGGTNNYLEGNMDVGMDNFSASWTIKPTELTTTTFYVSYYIKKSPTLFVVLFHTIYHFLFLSKYTSILY